MAISQEPETTKEPASKDVPTPENTAGPAAQSSDKPDEASEDFKIVEIWVRKGQIEMDAVEGFWKDKIRAVGILDYCIDTVKNFKPPKPKIVQPKGSMMNFARKVMGNK